MSKRQSLVTHLTRIFLLWFVIPGTLILGTGFIYLVIIFQLHMKSDFENINQNLMFIVEDYFNENLEILNQFERFTYDIPYFTNIVNQYKVYSNSFESIYLLDHENKLIESIPKTNYFSQHIIEGKKYPYPGGKTLTISTPYFSLNTNHISVGISLKGAQAPYRIVGELDLFLFQKFLNKMIETNKQEVVIITDTFGNVISHNDYKQVLTRSNIGSSLATLIEADNNFFKLPLISIKGTTHVIVHSKIDQLGLSIISGKSIKSILKPIIFHAGLTFFFFYGGIITLVIFFKYKIREFMVKPIIDFTHEIKNLDNDKISSLVPNQSNLKIYEIYELRFQFNHLMQNISVRDSKLRKNKTLLETIANTMQDALAMIDYNDHIIFWNKAAEKMFGYTLEEISNIKFHTIIPTKDDRPHAQNQFRKFCTTGHSDVMNKLRIVDAVCKDGSILPVEISINAFQDENQWYIVGSIRDISKRIQTEQSLKDNLKLLNDAQRIAKMGNWVWEIDTGNLTWTDEIYRMFGYPPQSFTASYKQFIQAIHPDDRNFVQDSVNQAIETLETYHIDHRIVLPNGVIRTVHESGEIILNDQNQPIKMIGTIQDISEKQTLLKQLEMSHKELEMKIHERTRALQEEINQKIDRENQLIQAQVFLEGYKKAIDTTAIVSVTDPDGVIIYTNDRFLQVTGYTSVEVIGKTHSILKTESTSKEIYADMWDTITKGQVWNNIIENISKSGESYFANTSIIPIMDKDQKIIEYIGIQHDITELYQALEKASVAEKSKSDFLASMSHEIRTPLNGIMGFIELMKQTDLSDTQKDYIDIIDVSSQNLRNLIDDILDFSKIESGKIDLDIHPFNPIDEFDKSVELYQAKADEKHIDLLYFSDPLQPDLIYGDPHKIKQVLTNLISNAIKFTPEYGNVKVSIRLETLENDQCTIRFSVIDTGIGIPQNKQKNIFNSFEQEDSSVTRQYGGTGLGLALSKRLISLMGSTIQLVSEPDKGSHFYFDLTFDLHNKSIIEQPIKFADRMLGVYINNEFLEHELILQEYMNSLFIQYETYNQIDRIISPPDCMFFFYSLQTAPIIESFKTIYPEITIVCIIDHPKSIEAISAITPHTISKPIIGSKIFNILNHLFASTDFENLHTSTKLDIIEKYPYPMLVVEDNSVNQKLLNIVLTQLGAKVTIVENGLEAVNIIKEKPFQMIIMDIHMPVMGGIEATQKIMAYQRDNLLPKTPIVALTADVIKEDLDVIHNVGIKHILKKPLEMEKLLAVLKEYLSAVPIEASSISHSEEQLESVTTIYHQVSTALGIDDEDILKDLINDFISSCFNEISKLKIAIESNNHEDIRLHAHSIKGMAANLQFKQITQIAQHIESNARSGSASVYHTYMKNLYNLVQHLSEAWNAGLND